MIGLWHWIRSFTYTSTGEIVKNTDGPVFAAHPQPNLYLLCVEYAEKLSPHFDLFQIAPWSNGSGEGYSFFELRNLNSNWGTAEELALVKPACDKAGILLSADITLRQQSGENGGPGVFNYSNGIGDRTPGWFQFFGQTGETKPPFVDQDDVFDPNGNYAFGRVVSYQHCNPAGASTADALDALTGILASYPVQWARLDDGKGMYVPFMQKLFATFPNISWYSEVDTGNPQELDGFVRLMDYKCAVEDYAHFWNCQRACNNYDLTQFNPLSQPGYWRWNNGMAIGFVNNPDVATSWNWASGGAISQQIAFNLLLAYALSMPLPFRLFTCYAEDYFRSSTNYPTGRGLKTYLDNLCWFVRTFGFGAFRECWCDRDVYAYTRNGDGGPIGWSGGCMIAANINTYNRRAMTIKQDVWAPGTWVHDYSVAGGATVRDFHINPDWTINITLLSNAYSTGTSYCLLAPGGVS